MQALFTKNTREAELECDRTLDSMPRTRQQLDRLRADVEELERRLAGWSRTLMEAGRHPDRELRLALGRFAARVLVEDLDSIEAFELAEAIARMTALDFALLEAVCQAAKLRRERQPTPTPPPASKKVVDDLNAMVAAAHAAEAAKVRGPYQSGAPESEFVRSPLTSPSLPRFVMAEPEPDPVYALLLRRFPALKAERLRHATERLEKSLHMIEPGTWGTLIPTAFGLRVLEVTRAPGDSEATTEAAGPLPSD
ncbi:MAG: hypothetical protein M9894_18590 [Planctomycetes bacterium]|nr:hypothetical protein [Planctomycetota bacterium]